jgi:predicted RNA binding protein YcfA (HicA-like mRNA interferase family)
MPEWPRLSGAEIIRVLERLGFRQIRQKGSHVVLRRGNVGCVVPLHRDVKTGTLAGIVRQSQLHPDEFLAVLKN